MAAARETFSMPSCFVTLTNEPLKRRSSKFVTEIDHKHHSHTKQAYYFQVKNYKHPDCVTYISDKLIIYRTNMCAVTSSQK